MRRSRRIFVFPLTCAAEKHLVSEKPPNRRFFKDTGVVLAGIERSPKISDFRASGIPVQERGDLFDTLIYVFLSRKKFHLKCAAQSLSAVVTKIPAAMAIPVPKGFHRAMHAPAPITEAQA